MKFFAPRGEYPPCGMFTPLHFCGLAVCLVLIVVSLYYSRNMSERTLSRLPKIFGIAIACMEAFKIGYSFVNGYTDLNSWFPLSFCSTFIYSLLLSGFGKGLPKAMADAFIAVACPAAGLAYLLIPSTSFQLYPFFHFQCFYSMFFHSCMICFGILYLHRGIAAPNRKNFLLFAAYYGVFAAVAIVLNVAFKQNLMMLMEPFALPFRIVYAIHDFSAPLYTLFVSLFYLFPTWGFSYLIFRVIGRDRPVSDLSAGEKAEMK